MVVVVATMSDVFPLGPLGRSTFLGSSVSRRDFRDQEKTAVLTEYCTVGEK